MWHAKRPAARPSDQARHCASAVIDIHTRCIPLARCLGVFVLMALTSLWSGCAAVDSGDLAAAGPLMPGAEVAADVGGAVPPIRSEGRQQACVASAVAAMRHRTPVATYYDHKLALVSGTVYAWSGADAPRAVLRGAVQVAVGDTQAYALDERRRLIAWQAGSDHREVLLDDVVFIAAGSSGLLAIRCDGSLWERSSVKAEWSRSANAAVQAWVGDGADYYVNPDGQLFARGQAHRGQYGDGLLTESPHWTPVAQDVVAVVAHTGHALYLRADGRVLGTGGNRFGPLGGHGFGDKADTWGFQFAGVRLIATGSRQSMAIRHDGSLWAWGEATGFLPRRILEDVVACSSGQGDSIALTSDGALWQWAPGQPPSRLQLPR
jgi:alpha-tubulin suppressor-like RCC1 family protein